MSTSTPRDELEVAAATPVSLARTLSEQRADAKAMAVLFFATPINEQLLALRCPCSPEGPPPFHGRPR